MPVFYLLGAAACGWLAGILARRDRALAQSEHGFDFPQGRPREPRPRFVAAQPREFRPMAWRSGGLPSAWQPFEF